jgi:hypothetical protein
MHELRHTGLQKSDAIIDRKSDAKRAVFGVSIELAHGDIIYSQHLAGMSDEGPATFSQRHAASLALDQGLANHFF